MGRFKIVTDPYNRKGDTINSLTDNFMLRVFAANCKPPLAVTKYNYLVIFGTGQKAQRLTIVIGNTDMPMSKVLWDRQLFISAIEFYRTEKDFPELTLVKNQATGNIIFQAEGLFEDSFGNDDSYIDQTGGGYE